MVFGYPEQGQKKFFVAGSVPLNLQFLELRCYLRCRAFRLNKLSPDEKLYCIG